MPSLAAIDQVDARRNSRKNLLSLGWMVVAHLSRMARSVVERWRKRSKHASCISIDLEKENVRRTKRASGFRRVLFHRSTWAVRLSPD